MPPRLTLATSLATSLATPLRRGSRRPPHRHHALLLLSLLPLALAACGDDAPRGRTVVLISIDTLRADRLGCTGYATAGTPNLDALAAGGAVYRNGVAPAPLTLPSHATLLSGLLPIEHGVRDNRPFAFPADRGTLATALKARGYATIAVIGGQPLARGCGLDVGFDVYDDDLPRGARGSVRLAERPADAVTDAALRALDGVESDRPLFLFAHYFDPHDPYVPPAPFAARFEGSPYDGEVAFVDREIGRLVEGLKRRGRFDDAVVMVVSDHGESLGEHGEPTHGLYVYDATIRVPVIVHDAGGARGAPADPVRLRDVHDFLLARAAGAEADLAAAGRRGEPALVESLYGALHCNYAQLRGLRTPEGRKYLEAGDEELYDLEHDPGETRDLASRDEERDALIAAREALAQTLSSLRAGVPGFQEGSLPGYLNSPRAETAVPTPSREENARRPSPRSRAAGYAHMQEGIRLHQLGLIEAAIAELDAAAAVDDENPTVHFWRGQARVRAAKEERDPARMEAAAQAFARASALRPDDTRARDMRIFCLAQLGRYDEAVAVGAEAERDGTLTPATLEVLGKLHLTNEAGAMLPIQNPHYDEARAADYLARSYEADPDGLDPRVLPWLAERYLERGDAVKAAAIRRRIAEESKAANPPTDPP